MERREDNEMDEHNMSHAIKMHSDEDQESVDDINANMIGAETVRPFIRDSVYYAAKDGLPLNLSSLLSQIDDVDTRNAIINQVSKPAIEVIFLFCI